MAAIVLGGASTIGGVGLGYQYGISGMWLVFAIGVGILLLSLLFAGRIQRLGVYTVSQMLELRYGPGSSVLSGVVMWGYTLMLSVTSTIAYATIFGALFDIGKVPAIILGGGVVIIYSTLGGMWSITLTDFVQFVIKTIGIFFILLPIALYKTGGVLRAGREAAGRRHLADRDRRRDDPDLLRHLHLRAAHRPGHLAAGVHRTQPRRGPLGRHRVGRVLPAVRGGRRGDRDGGQGAAARAGVPRRRVRRSSSRCSCRRCWPAWCSPPRWPR